MSDTDPEFELTFLGTGTSIGVPVIGCDCPVCQSDDPINQRSRSSVFVKTPEVQFVVDTGPDFRMQCLREGIRELDAALFTHAHSDHIMGFDDLRRFSLGADDIIDIYATEDCFQRLKLAFDYAFNGENRYPGYLKPEPHLITGSFEVGDLQVTPIPVEHGKVETIGFHFETKGGKRIAYVPDVKVFPESSRKICRDVDVLIIDGLQPKEHWTHLSVPEAVDVALDLRARQAWLTHFTCRVDYKEIGPTLPDHIGLSHDGLKLSL